MRRGDENDQIGGNCAVFEVGRRDDDFREWRRGRLLGMRGGVNSALLIG